MHVIDDYVSKHVESKKQRIIIDRDCLHWSPFVSTIMVEEEEQLACHEVRYARPYVRYIIFLILWNNINKLCEMR